jgi:hypothetical protein
MSTEAKRNSKKSKDAVAVVKRRKIVDNDLETSEEDTVNGILILNDDCFCKIFMHLDKVDLLSVIRSHKRFQFACEYVYKRKYCKFAEQLSNLNYYPNSINLRQMKYSIQMLEHFGHLITNLCVRFKFGRIKTLLDAVAANCKNLLELELQHEGSRVRKKWSSFASSINRMKSFLNDLNTQFPKLCHLKLGYSIESKTCPYSDAVIRSIPTLTSFECKEKIAGHLLSEEKLKQFVRLNPQLECLAFTVDQWELYDTDDPWDISSSFISCLDESLPMLKCLEINRVSTRDLPTPAAFPIRFKNLKELKFHSFLERVADPDVGFMSFSSDSVEVLKLSIFHSNIHRFLKDITQFKNLKVLHLEYPIDLISDNLDANGMERAVWGRYGEEQLILHNPNLIEIILSPHPGDDTTNTLNIIYGDVTHYDLHGSTWIVSDELFEGYSFRKVLQ